MAAIVVPREIRRRSLTAKITVYALIIDVKFPCHILLIFVRNVSHKPSGLSLFPVKLEWANQAVPLPSPKVAIYRLHLTLQEELKGRAN
jgi:hypothetical protein